MIFAIIGRDNPAAWCTGLTMMTCGCLMQGTPSEKHTAVSPLGATQDILFPGTAAWRTYERAQAYLRQCPDLERQKVVALDGCWETDTWQHPCGLRYTIPTLPIVR